MGSTRSVVDEDPKMVDPLPQQGPERSSALDWARIETAVRRVIARTTRTRDSDDLAQSAMAEVWIAVQNGRRVGDWLAYASAVTKNVCRDWIRSRMAGTLEPTPLTAHALGAASPTAPDAPPLRHRFRAWLETIVDDGGTELPPRQRKVLAAIVRGAATGNAVARETRLTPGDVLEVLTGLERRLVDTSAIFPVRKSFPCPLQRTRE
jgi:DNA-directed RNA polymerase specialized sigma24 family protein